MCLWIMYNIFLDKELLLTLSGTFKSDYTPSPNQLLKMIFSDENIKARHGNHIGDIIGYSITAPFNDIMNFLKGHIFKDNAVIFVSAEQFKGIFENLGLLEKKNFKILFMAKLDSPNQSNPRFKRKNEDGAVIAFKNKEDAIKVKLSI